MVSLARALLLTSTAFAAANAQVEFQVAGRPTQIHGFFSQGFAYSDQNNYLTMNTSKGSFALTDAGLNASMKVTDHFRIGAQAYVRNIGQLGRGHVELDWVYADYKFQDWFGIRAGKVKTALGLFNDTQDTEFLHTWAILPQSVYPLDLRSSTIAHTGADVYGEVGIGKAGSLSYTGYFGARTFDPRAGFYFMSEDNLMPIRKDSGYAAGGDVRWTTWVPGLVLGGSWMKMTEDRRGIYQMSGDAPYRFVDAPDHTTAAYGTYLRGKLRFDGEFRTEKFFGVIHSPVFEAMGLPTYLYNGSYRSWFLSVAYRLSKWLEIGTYQSRYYFNQPVTETAAGPLAPNPAADHIFDQTVTARFDITKFWNFKLEAHIMDGHGDLYSVHGFYARTNPDGLRPKTNLFVVRTGFSF
jgi:hypothetical protein